MLLHRLLERATHFPHVRFVDLSSYPLCCSLDSPSEESVKLLGVAEILAMEDLEFPVLLDNSVDDDSVVVERGPEDGRVHTCDLHHD
jgi:hypothetical protein